MAVVSPKKQNFRFYNDDGSESAATPMGNAGANVSGDVDVNVRLRIALYWDSPGTAGGAHHFEYRKNGGSWTDMTTSSSNARSSNSTNLTDGSSCTQRLLVTYTFIATNYGQDEDGLLAGVTCAQNYGYDVETCFQARSTDMADTDYLEFRIVQTTNGAEITGSSPYPRYTIASAPPPDRSVPGPSAVPGPCFAQCIAYCVATVRDLVVRLHDFLSRRTRTWQTTNLLLNPVR